jgi:hypothetical protein
MTQKLHDLIVDLETFLNEEIEGPLETEDGWLIKHHLYRYNDETFRLDKMTRNGWYGLSANTSRQCFIPWRWTTRNSLNPRRIVSAPYPLEVSDRKMK